MNQGNRGEIWKLEMEKLQNRINALAEIQETVRGALEKPGSQEERQSLEGMLRRHKAKEEHLRQELAAIQKSLDVTERGILYRMPRSFCLLLTNALT
jgi:hypothetical protein